MKPEFLPSTFILLECSGKWRRRIMKSIRLQKCSAAVSFCFSFSYLSALKWRNVATTFRWCRIFDLSSPEADKQSAAIPSSVVLCRGWRMRRYFIVIDWEWRALFIVTFVNECKAAVFPVGWVERMLKISLCRGRPVSWEKSSPVSRSGSCCSIVELNLCRHFRDAVWDY